MHHSPGGKPLQKQYTTAQCWETVAQMALLTEKINPNAPRLKEALIKKHFERKHGPDSYYGQQ
jgi:L-ribulose-5-phosphate 4-epimerase